MTSPSQFSPSPLKPLHYLILLALTEGPLHGYALKKEISRRTGGEVTPGAGSLYRAVSQLLDSGWIRDADQRPAPGLDDPRRTYFQMTPRGREAAVAETERLARLVSGAREAGLIAGEASS